MNEKNSRYPLMLVTRNTPDGMIWQAYRVQNETEEDILSFNAITNGFLVEFRPADYTEETFPNWRDTPDWKSCLEEFNKAI